jgi:CO dehydrogenase/acetyl-CoA synthase beta subunit
VLIPEVGGVMVVTREDRSVTPAGMTFAELLAIAADAQTPGIIGHTRDYLFSDKYLAAEGGIKRVIWMSTALKEELAEGLRAASERAGVSDLMDKIADGDICADPDDLLAFLEERGHPALTMDPML